MTSVSLRRGRLRYGENPHQRAAFYVEPGPWVPTWPPPRCSTARSFRTTTCSTSTPPCDWSGCFAEPAACILKHNNPCGAAVAADLADAFELAYEGDPVSAFGGIVGLNRPVDRATAERTVPAGPVPGGDPRPGFRGRRPRRVDDQADAGRTASGCSTCGADRSRSPPSRASTSGAVEGGLLVQSWDTLEPDPRPASRHADAPRLRASARDLAFAWRVCQWSSPTRSSVASGRQLVGVGAGQMSRLDSVRIAVEKAGERARGAVLASDAFFPFRDGPDLAAAAGVTAIIQPGDQNATTRPSPPATSTGWP